MENCPTQAVLPLVGLAAEKVIRDRYKRPRRDGRHPLTPCVTVTRAQYKPYCCIKTA
ncbi:MAG: hypothetical protein ACQESR_15505 [Planctomycetota bacterium]